jgi:hypothetical protein
MHIPESVALPPQGKAMLQLCSKIVLEKSMFCIPRAASLVNIYLSCSENDSVVVFSCGRLHLSRLKFCTIARKLLVFQQQDTI